MKTLALVLLLTMVLGCQSRPSEATKDAQRQFQATVQAVQDDLQWKLDDATAVQIFDDGTKAGVNTYLAFRKCHEDPPAKEANKKTCAILQKRVAAAEARAAAQRKKEQAEW